MSKKFLVTGGTGFIGSALVRRLADLGHFVRVLDDDSRGKRLRFDAATLEKIEIVAGDIRDLEAVKSAARGMDSVCHLAYVNGTEFFYTIPDVILEIAVKGMMNVLDACQAEDVGELILASSSEVYQTPAVIPTPEDVPLVVPDPLNPRYSYGGGKMISELLALNYGRSRLRRVLVFRPHNVYGPDMGWEHVVPQLVLRMVDQMKNHPSGPVPFPIQGNGSETRAFTYIDDCVHGIVKVVESGRHMEIYNVGADEELTIAGVAGEIAKFFGREIRIQPGPVQKGGTPRRCPNIQKLRALGYAPSTPFSIGLPKAAKWYAENSDKRPRKG
ncbi:MAG: NAD-dependent epimerase/dehydratase family protein [Planctomycetota bacterium]|nr:NAD-dependent epimerase/dehydratase family protein [Planctomycetota bacterium]